MITIGLTAVLRPFQVDKLNHGTTRHSWLGVRKGRGVRSQWGNTRQQHEHGKKHAQQHEHGKKTCAGHTEMLGFTFVFRELGPETLSLWVNLQRETILDFNMTFFRCVHLRPNWPFLFVPNGSGFPLHFTAACSLLYSTHVVHYQCRQKHPHKCFVRISFRRNWGHLTSWPLITGGLKRTPC